MNFVSDPKTQVDIFIDLCHNRHIKKQVSGETFVSQMYDLDVFHSKIDDEIVAQLMDSKPYAQNIVTQCNLYRCGMLDFDDIQFRENQPKSQVDESLLNYFVDNSIEYSKAEEHVFSKNPRIPAEVTACNIYRSFGMKKKKKKSSLKSSLLQYHALETVPVAKYV